MHSKKNEINWLDKIIILEAALATWIVVMADQVLFILEHWLDTWIWDYSTLDYRAFFVWAWWVLLLAARRQLTDYKKQYTWKT